MRPLEGIRVVDLTVAVAGPVAAHLLGDLGADVIRIEPPFARPVAHLDVAPLLDGAPDHPYNRVVGYNDLHRSKRAITLDLQKALGRDTLLKLTAASDVVIENMAPRVLPSLGLSYDALRTGKPDIVLVSMPAFGLSGPLSDRVSYGPGIDAMSGLAHLTGYPDRGPMNAANYYCDYNAAVLAATATLAALRHRDRTGAGQHIELSMLEGELQLVADALLDFTMNGRVQRRAGNAHPSMAPHGVYQCAGKDRWVAIACENDVQWRSLCAAIDRPDFASDPRCADVVSRMHARDQLDVIVSAWTSVRTPHDCATALQNAGVPAGVMQTVGELFDDPQVRGRQWIQYTQHPEAGRTPHSRAAFTLSRTPSPIERPAPLFAQHNDEVLRGLLGLGDDAIRELREQRVTRNEPPAPR